MKASKILVIPLALFLFFSFAKDTSAACLLQTVTWDKNRGAVGDTINFSVMGGGCAGWEASVKVWEEDGAGGDDLVNEQKIRFGVDSKLTGSWTISANALDTLGESEFYLEVVAGSGQGSYLNSYDAAQNGGNKSVLYVASGGVGTGGAKIDFDLNPKSSANAVVTQVNFTLTLTATDLNEFDRYCFVTGPKKLKVHKTPSKSTNATEVIREQLFSISSADVSQNKKSLDFTQNIDFAGRANATYSFEGEILCGNTSVLKSSSVYFTVGQGGFPTDTSTATATATSPGGGTASGSGVFSFRLENPLKADSLMDFIDLAIRIIFNISIPIAVVLILWAGFKILASRGNPAGVTEGRKILQAVVIGLAIIMIGRGFVTLTISILNLGDSGNLPGTTTYSCNFGGQCVVDPNGTGQYTDPQCDNKCSSGNTSSGVKGSICNGNNDCSTGLICKNKMCQSPQGNVAGEACVSHDNCDVGFRCDNTSTGQIVVDGRKVGTCFQQSSALGKRPGEACAQKSECLSGLECTSGVCQRKDGNLVNEGCKVPSNCSSKICNTQTGLCMAGKQIGERCSNDNPCASSLVCDYICERQGGNLNGEPCLGNNNCKSNYCNAAAGQVFGVCASRP